MKAVAVVGILILSLLVPPAISQVPDDQLIVPGQRIGKWTLDMTLNDLLKMNGSRHRVWYGRALQPLPHTDMVLPDVWEHRWDRLDGFYALTVGRDGQKVIVLAIESPYHKTAKGIGAFDGSRQTLEWSSPGFVEGEPLGH